MSSKEQGLKRVLSPESVNITPGKVEDKRRRQDSVDIGKDMMEPTEGTDTPTSMSDLKKCMDAMLKRLDSTAKKEDLSDLATKSDLKLLDDRTSAQGQKINQLMNELKSIKTNFDSLQQTVDRDVAVSITGSLGRDPGSEPGRTTTSMAAGFTNKTGEGLSKRRNLVVEGLRGDSEDEMRSAILEISVALEMTLFNEEIEQVDRMTRRDQTNKAPGPVLITLSRIILRDTFLHKKGKLQGNESFNKVFINADEEIEVGRAKSFLRKAAYNAKIYGDVVFFKHNLVTINGVPYSTEDIGKIPEKYFKKYPDLDVQEKEDRPQACAQKPILEMDISEAPKDVYAKEGLIRCGERMRLTKKGLCFSSPSAYPSNMAYVPINFRKKSFESNEHGYQWNKAMHHKMAPLANKIKTTEDSFRVKAKGGIIVADLEWNLMAPDILAEMFAKKMEQHPDLLERLLDTYPLPLIEACTDDTWGGGAPFESDVYDSDEPLPGRNL